MWFVVEDATRIGFFVTVAMALVAAVIDFRQFHVPNALTFPLGLSGLLFHASVSGLSGLQYSAGGIGMGLLVLMLFYVMGIMGAGDVKLLAAVGAWIGAANTIYVFCVAGICMGVYSLVALAWQRRLHEIPAIFQVTFVQLMTLGRHVARSDSASLTAKIKRPDRRRYVAPFAVMIVIGVLFVAARQFES